MSRRPHLDLDNYLPYLVNRIGSALVANFTQHVLVRHDMSIAMWRVLAALSNNDGEQRLIDLAGMTSIDVSTLRVWSPGWSMAGSPAQAVERPAIARS